jgi:predicted metal-dependent hydrolase
MKLEETEKLALNLIKKYLDPSWSFNFDNAKRRLGACNYGKKKISLSKSFVLLNNKFFIEKIILHEIAHALAGFKAKHSQKFYETLKKINGNLDKNLLLQIKKTPYSYQGQCETCKKIYYTYKSNKNIACKSCCIKYNKGQFSSKYQIKFKKI